MKFLVFFIVLVISAASVALGVDWIRAPMSPMPTSPFELRAAKPPLPPVVQQAAAQPAPLPKPVAAPAPVAPAPVPAPVAAAPVVAPEPVPQASAIVVPEPQPAAAPAPQCDVAACERAYRSFTASDCTYQPSDGPRRLCTRGTPPAAASSPRTDARAQATCNIAACSNAYISFNAGDCTYQPSDGPRRICDKQ